MHIKILCFYPGSRVRDRLGLNQMNIHFKRAEASDCDLLFQWTNDDEVRRNSFTTEKIEYENHVKWFKRRLSGNDSIIYICYAGEIPVGQIRIDICGCEGMINYSISRTERGKGYGTCILKSIIDTALRDIPGLVLLYGNVKYDNIPSQKAFEKAGYEKEEGEDFIRYSYIMAGR